MGTQAPELLKLGDDEIVEFLPFGQIPAGHR